MKIKTPELKQAHEVAGTYLDDMRRHKMLERADASHYERQKLPTEIRGELDEKLKESRTRIVQIAIYTGAVSTFMHANPKIRRVFDDFMDGLNQYNESTERAGRNGTAR